MNEEDEEQGTPDTPGTAGGSAFGMPVVRGADPGLCRGWALPRLLLPDPLGDADGDTLGTVSRPDRQGAAGGAEICTLVSLRVGGWGEQGEGIVYDVAGYPHLFGPGSTPRFFVVDQGDGFYAVAFRRFWRTHGGTTTGLVIVAYTLTRCRAESAAEELNNV